MTTIILVSIGILIAAVSALFVIFYGGDAFGSGQDKAEATRLVNEGVQIQAAVQAFRAQEDRMPGTGNGGVDGVALWDLVCQDYLTQIPAGANRDVAPSFDCTPAGRAAASTTIPSAWKVDYNYGIARSILGVARDSEGRPTEAYRICQAARVQLNLPGEPLACSTEGISNREPCCIMSADEAAA